MSVIWVRICSTQVLGKHRYVNLYSMTIQRIPFLCILFCIGIFWGLCRSSISRKSLDVSLISSVAQNQVNAGLSSWNPFVVRKTRAESLLCSILLHGFKMNSEPGENISGLGAQSECLWGKEPSEWICGLGNPFVNKFKVALEMIFL